MHNDLTPIIRRLNTAEGASALLRGLGYGEFLEPEPWEADISKWHVKRRKTGELQPLAKSAHVIATPGEDARLYSYFYELNDGSCDRFGKIKISAFRPIAEKHASDAGVPLIFFAPPVGENSDEVVLATFTRVGKVGAEDRIALRWVRFHRDDPKARTPLDVLAKLPFDRTRHLRDIILSAFALEPLTDNFYEEYHKIFDILKADLAQQLDGNKEEKDQRAHEFASLLMNRLMFLWFVQKKGWLDGKQDYLLKLFDNYGEGNFYTNRVQQVFMMLNKAENNQLRKSIRDNYDFDTGNLPFLNGGLFDDLEMNKQTTRDKKPFKINNRFFKDIFQNLFAKYNFTVEESTPLNMEVAVDPEMLGHVFERMVTGRHESGSYYTPKQVVNFMCKEALKGYLCTNTDENETAISALVDAGSREKIKDIPFVINAINKIIACDPACGSGAYLLGMLHNIIDIQKTLMNIDETDTKTLHKWKERIISHSIYGVDIDPFAVSIAKLRLWLSLVVDETRDPLGDDRPDVALPNLEFKIEIGDSLTAPNPTDRNSMNDMFRVELLQLADKLGELKDEFLRTHDNKSKQEIRQRIYATENRLRGCLQAEKKLPANAFDWRVEFAEVFKREGFDVVIANPPYVRADAQFKHITDEVQRQNEIAKWKDYRELLKRSNTYQTLYEKWDLFVPFLERAYQLLKPNGHMCFIISNAFNASKYMTKSHEFFIENATIERVDFCTDIPLFDAGVLNTIVHFSKKRPHKNHIPVRVRRWGKDRSEFAKNAEVLSSKHQKDIGRELFKKDMSEVLGNFDNTLTWGEICYVSVGLVLQAEEKKYQGEFVKKDLISDFMQGIYKKPYVEAKWVGRYFVERIKYLEWDTDRVPTKIRRPTFPELYPPKKILKGGMTGATYDELGLLCNHSITISLLWEDLQKVNNRSIEMSVKKDFAVDDAVSFRSELEKNSKRFDLKYLLAILNSSYGFHFLNSVRRSQLGFYPDDLKQLPIKSIDKKAQQPFVALVDRILAAKAKDPTADTSDLEFEIDVMVYKLYELTFDEVKLIDPDFPLSREEYAQS